MVRCFAALCLCVMLLASILNTAIASNQIIINPTSDGSIYNWNGTLTVFSDFYVQAASNGGIWQGIIKFPMSSINEPSSRVLLSVNPYGTPVDSKALQVYGFSSNNSQLNATDYDAGALLENWYLPTTLSWGQDAYLDVTQFVQNASGPYVCFNLRSSGIFQLCSLSYKYDHPSQLTVTTVPEPSSILALLCGIVAMGGIIRRRR